MDAVIVTKKASMALFGRTLSPDSNLDVVTYRGEDNTSYIDSVFTIMEQYIELEIHKLTGVTYTEYKSMTPLEKNIFLEHVNYKTRVGNYDFSVADNEDDGFNRLGVENDKLFS